VTGIDDHSRFVVMPQVIAQPSAHVVCEHLGPLAEQATALLAIDCDLAAYLAGLAGQAPAGRSSQHVLAAGVLVPTLVAVCT